jgi:transposase-like protein
MLAGMTTTRQHLVAWVHAQGLAALDELFREEAVALAGPKGRHQPQRTHHHWGTTATELTFGGRRLQVHRPRVRQTAGGGEATLPSVAAFRDRDPLTARVMQQLLAGVSTRQYEASLEALPSGRPTRGSSKSAVSRTVVRRTRQRLQEPLARRLAGLEVVALFMDGVVIAGQTVIVVLGITREGGKVPLGLRLGSTENTGLCTELLQDLLARGLTLEGRVLWVIDGGKGLRKALGDVFGDDAVIQRCQLHKARNLDALVPKARQVYVRESLRRPYRAASAATARRQLTALATWLERNGHADAAASVREGLEDTLTVLKLGIPPTLRRFFATTNCIENLIGTLRHVTRHIKRWRDGDMRRRWIGSACCAPPSASGASSGMVSWGSS